MRANIETASLTHALGAVKAAVSTQRPFVQLEVGDTLAVRADNLDLGVEATVPLEGRSRKGKILVPHRPLADFISKADGTHVELVLDDDMLTCQDGGASLALASVSDDWFPHRPPADDHGTPLDEEGWARVRGLTEFCATESSKGPLTGVLFADGEAVATDAYSLAAVTHPFGITGVMPASIIKAMPSDVSSVLVRGGAGVIELVSDNVRVTTAALAGDFPNWRQAIPESKVATVTVGTVALSKAVDRASVLAKDAAGRSGRMIRVYPEDGSMVVESIPDSEKGDARSIVSEVIAAEIEGEWGYHFGLGTGQVGSLGAILGKPDEVSLELHGPATPVTVTTEDVFVLIAVIRVGQQ